LSEPAKIILTMGTSIPAQNPAIGKIALYPKTDGWYQLDSDGVETKIEGGVIQEEAIMWAMVL